MDWETPIDVGSGKLVEPGLVHNAIARNFMMADKLEEKTFPNNALLWSHFAHLFWPLNHKKVKAILDIFEEMCAIPWCWPNAFFHNEYPEALAPTLMSNSRFVELEVVKAEWTITRAGATSAMLTSDEVSDVFTVLPASSLGTREMVRIRSASLRVDRILTFPVATPFITTIGQYNQLQSAGLAPYLFPQEMLLSLHQGCRHRPEHRWSVIYHRTNEVVMSEHAYCTTTVCASNIEPVSKF